MNNIPGADNDTLSPLLNKVTKSTGCRAADDEAAWNRSARLFYNPTKYDRTTDVPPGVYQASSRGALVCNK